MFIGLDAGDLFSKLADTKQGIDEEAEKKAAFKKKMKSHYKNEFNASAMLR